MKILNLVKILLKYWWKYGNKEVIIAVEFAGYFNHYPIEEDRISYIQEKIELNI